MHHLAFEGAGGDCVDGDTTTCETYGEDFGEVMHGGFAGAVGKVVYFGDFDTVDAADVNDAGGIVGGGAVFEQGHEHLGKEEDAFHVDVHGTVVAVFGKVVEGFAPGGSGVVDEDIEGVFVFFDAVDEGFPAFFVGEVCGNRDAFADFREFFGYGVADFGFARGDVYFCAVLHVTQGDHESDAA